MASLKQEQKMAATTTEKSINCPFLTQVVSPCKIESCHCYFPNVHTTKCILQTVKNRELFLSEIMHAFNIPSKRVFNKEYIRQIELAQHYISFYNALQAISTTTHCPNCGVLRTGRGTCLRQEKCKERSNWIQELKSQTPFNLVPTPDYKIWYLYHHQEDYTFFDLLRHLPPPPSATQV